VFNRFGKHAATHGLEDMCKCRFNLQESIKTSANVDIHDGAAYLLDDSASLSFSPSFNFDHPASARLNTMTQVPLPTWIALTRSVLSFRELRWQVALQTELLRNISVAKSRSNVLSSHEHGLRSATERAHSSTSSVAVLPDQSGQSINAAAASIVRESHSELLQSPQRCPIQLRDLSTSLFDYLDAAGFVKVTALDRVSLQYTASRFGPESCIEIHGQSLDVLTCADSLKTLMALVAHLQTSVQALNPVPVVPEVRVAFLQAAADQLSGRTMASAASSSHQPPSVSAAIASAMNSPLMSSRAVLSAQAVDATQLTHGQEVGRTISSSVQEDYVPGNISSPVAAVPAFPSFELTSYDDIAIAFSRHAPRALGQDTVRVSRSGFQGATEAAATERRDFPVLWYTEDGYAPPVLDNHFSLSDPDLEVANILQGISSGDFASPCSSGELLVCACVVKCLVNVHTYLCLSVYVCVFVREREKKEIDR
jgi:hypothetical protein